MVNLDQQFFNKDTVTVARELLGCFLHHHIGDGLVSGQVVETEAYLSRDDPACHAARGKTKRNAAMFGPPGTAYIYFIYGNYFCFNVVTGPEGVGEAVLVRAVEPVHGIKIMVQRRGLNCRKTELTNGPGKLCQAYAIDRTLNGHNLHHPPLYLTGRINHSACLPIIATPRIGLSKGKDKLLRFVVSDNRYLSRR